MGGIFTHMLGLNPSSTTYVNSVQQFSITIASGSTTGTATITAVGSQAFIVYGGLNPSVTLQANQSLAWLTLTNSTTITATRNNGLTGTIVIKGSIVDATTSLVTSVQYGTLTIASSATSGTATVSATTNGVVHFLGSTSAAANSNADEANSRVSLSGTTVTGNRGTSSSNAVVVGFVVIDFAAGALQSLQNVSASSSSSVTSYTATISSVTMTNAVCFFAGNTIATSTNNSATTCQRGSLTNATTFTVNINTGVANAKVFNATVVEFKAGVLVSSVQRGTTTLTSATSNTSTITSVNTARAALSFLENTTTSITGNWRDIKSAAALTGATVVTTTLNNSNTITDSWEIFEF